jgi:hypothetical protein
VATFLPQAQTTAWGGGVSSVPSATGKTPMGATNFNEPSWAVGSAREAAHRHDDELEWWLGFGSELVEK